MMKQKGRKENLSSMPPKHDSSVFLSLSYYPILSAYRHTSTLTFSYFYPRISLSLSLSLSPSLALSICTPCSVNQILIFARSPMGNSSGHGSSVRCIEGKKNRPIIFIGRRNSSAWSRDFGQCFFIVSLWWCSRFLTL